MAIKKYHDYINEDKEDLTFVTKMENTSDITIYKKLEEDQYVEPGKMTINWGLDLDLRKDCINSFGIVVYEIKGSYNIEEDEKEPVEVEFEYSYPGKEQEFEVEVDIISEIKIGGVIIPTSLEIDYNHKKITVSF